MNYTDIRFPGLGITLNHVGRSLSIGNFQIMFYGMIIACGFLAGLWICQQEAKRTGQDPETYMDYFLWVIIPAIVGIRAYYVAFTWDYYKDHLLEIFNLRNGGLGVVGGIFAGFLVLVIFTKVRKLNIFQMMDTLVLGVLIGQVMGRWGNFFNREAFGCFTDGFTAMQIPVPYFEQVGRLQEIYNTGLLDHTVNYTINGQVISYISVHPTFLYESVWNLSLLGFLLFFRYHKKFHGEMACIYLIGYGLGRFLIEGLRVDQLQVGGSGIAATQIVCILAFVGGWFALIRGRKRASMLDKSEES